MATKRTEEVKEDFIKVLSSLTPIEINELIHRKTKGIKFIEPIKFE